MDWNTLGLIAGFGCLFTGNYMIARRFIFLDKGQMYSDIPKVIEILIVLSMCFLELAVARNFQDKDSMKLHPILAILTTLCLDNGRRATLAKEELKKITS